MNVKKLSAIVLLLAYLLLAASPVMASYYTYLHPFDTYHDQCTINCLWTDPYGLGPGSPLIGIQGGCPPGHLNVSIGVTFQAYPEPNAIEPWWIGNASVNFSDGFLYTVGTCGDYFFGNEGQWDYEQNCDLEEEFLEEPIGDC